MSDTDPDNTTTDSPSGYTLTDEEKQNLEQEELNRVENNPEGRIPGPETEPTEEDEENDDE